MAAAEKAAADAAAVAADPSLGPRKAKAAKLELRALSLAVSLLSADAARNAAAGDVFDRDAAASLAPAHPDTFMPKATLRSLYALSSNDLTQSLQYDPVWDKPYSRRYPNPPTPYYRLSEVQGVAVAKHGGASGLAKALRKKGG